MEKLERAIVAVMALGAMGLGTLTAASYLQERHLREQKQVLRVSPDLVITLDVK